MYTHGVGGYNTTTVVLLIILYRLAGNRRCVQEHVCT